MGKKDDGGPAYPVTDFNNDVNEREVMGGMSLRDRIAIAVFPAVLSEYHARTQHGRYHFDSADQEVARRSYRLADAMIAARRE